MGKTNGILREHTQTITTTTKADDYADEKVEIETQKITKYKSDGVKITKVMPADNEESKLPTENTIGNS